RRHRLPFDLAAEVHGRGDRGAGAVPAPQVHLAVVHVADAGRRVPRGALRRRRGRYLVLDPAPVVGDRSVQGDARHGAAFRIGERSRGAGGQHVLAGELGAVAWIGTGGERTGLAAEATAPN